MIHRLAAAVFLLALALPAQATGDPRQSSGGGFYSKMSGYGLTTAMTSGCTDHWGIGVLAGYTNINGDRTFSYRDNNGTPLISPASGCSAPRTSRTPPCWWARRLRSTSGSSAR